MVLAFFMVFHNLLTVYSLVVPLSVENFWNRLWLMKAERGTLAGRPLEAHDPRKLARAAKSTTNWSSVNVVG